jgi:hypothetical protein
MSNKFYISVIKRTVDRINSNARQISMSTCRTKRRATLDRGRCYKVCHKYSTWDHGLFFSWLFKEVFFEIVVCSSRKFTMCLASISDTYGTSCKKLREWLKSGSTNWDRCDVWVCGYCTMWCTKVLTRNFTTYSLLQHTFMSAFVCSYERDQASTISRAVWIKCWTFKDRG